MLCALVFSAVTAQGASAATKSTTAFTCASAAGGAGFSKEHCKAADPVSSGAKFQHVAIAENTTTDLSGTNQKTQKTGAETNETSIWRLKTTLNGATFEFSANGVTMGEGAWIENKKAASGEHYIHGEGKLHLTEVRLTKPAGTGCAIFADEGRTQGAKETLTINQLTFTSEGQGDALLLQPAVAGQPIATFFIAGCVAPFEALNGTHTLFSKLKTTSIDGATLNFTHANVTSQGTLFLDNEFTPFGIGGTLTLSGRAKGSGGAFTPLSPTTVETP